MSIESINLKSCKNCKCWQRLVSAPTSGFCQNTESATNQRLTYQTDSCPAIQPIVEANDK